MVDSFCMNDQVVFKALNNVSEKKLEENRQVNRSLGIPCGGSHPVHPRLAIVGGGLDVDNFIDELKRFPGEIWAINGAYSWCCSVGIDAVFYAIDPSPMILSLVDDVHSAVLADTVHQDIFIKLGSKVREIIWTGLHGISHGTTAASTAPMAAAERGQKHVTFYGCQSNFTELRTHIYKNDKLSKMWLTCGDVEYVSCPQFIMQAELIAGIARGLPQSISVKGSGFLSNLIEHGTYRITHVNRLTNDYLKR